MMLGERVMFLCPNCEKEVLEWYNICPYCGQSLKVDAEAVRTDKKKSTQLKAIAIVFIVAGVSMLIGGSYFYMMYLSSWRIDTATLYNLCAVFLWLLGVILLEVGGATAYLGGKKRK